MKKHVIQNTKNFQEYTNDFNIVKNVYSPPNSHYFHINLIDFINDLNLSDIDFNKINSNIKILISNIIGENGKVFKAITKQSKVKYIWYNDQTNVIEVWGDEIYINNAVERIKNRILLVINGIITDKQYKKMNNKENKKNKENKENKENLENVENMDISED